MIREYEVHLKLTEVFYLNKKELKHVMNSKNMVNDLRKLHLIPSVTSKDSVEFTQSCIDFHEANKQKDK